MFLTRFESRGWSIVSFLLRVTFDNVYMIFSVGVLKVKFIRQYLIKESCGMGLVIFVMDSSCNKF
jgi:hypothetical protein